MEKLPLLARLLLRKFATAKRKSAALIVPRLKKDPLLARLLLRKFATAKRKSAALIVRNEKMNAARTRRSAGWTAPRRPRATNRAPT